MKAKSSPRGDWPEYNLARLPFMYESEFTMRMPSRKQRMSSRVAALDVLRGIAVVLVLGRHIAPPDATVSGPLKYVAGWGTQIGWTGVDLFFVLSGFLVSGLLFTEYQERGSLDIVRFLIRRGLKIYPGFYFMIGATVVVTVMTGVFKATMIPRIVAEIFYVQNYAHGLWNHTWSLAIEEHFYVLLAVGLFLLVRRPSEWDDDPFRRFLPLAIFIVFAIAAGRLLAPYAAPLTGRYVDATLLPLETHTRIDTLGVGVIASYLYHFHRQWFLNTAQRHRTAIMIASAVLLTPPLFWPRGESAWLPSVGLLCIAFGFAGVVVVGLTSAEPSRPPRLAARALTATFAFVGFHSYSVYLWHVPVQSFLMPYVGRIVTPATASADSAFLITTTAYLGAAIVIGVVVGKLIEQPALAFRDRLFPTRAGRRLSPVVLQSAT